MANQIYKCKTCGGDLAWDPTIQKLKCKYCDSEFSPEDYETQNNDEYEKGQSTDSQATDDSNINPDDLRMYKCSYCGAEIITDKTTMATTCIYCGNPVVLQEQLDTNFKPQYIIPFKVTKEEAENAYMKFANKIFTPKDFLSKRHIKKIKGVYIPFWLYDILVKGNVEIEGDKERQYSDSNYDYTEHNIYNVSRAGSAPFFKIPVDASSKTPNDAMDSVEPFDYEDLIPFTTSCLAGFLAERYDENPEDCKNRAEIRAKNSLINLLDSTVVGYTSKRTISSHAEILQNTCSYALLPTYLLYTKYKGKDYLFAINGQTKKVCGNLPLSPKKVIFYILTRFLICYTICTTLISILLTLMS